MKINLVFNIEGTGELRRLVDALETVATFQDKIKREEELEKLEETIMSKRRELEVLNGELKAKREILNPNKSMEKICMETTKMTEPMTESLAISRR